MTGTLSSSIPAPGGFIEAALAVFRVGGNPIDRLGRLREFIDEAHRVETQLKGEISHLNQRKRTAQSLSGEARFEYEQWAKSQPLAIEKPQPEPEPVRPKPQPRVSCDLPGSDLRPALTFENLIVGPFNDAAVEACQKAINGKRPYSSYIHGPAGCGKTHILQAAIVRAKARGKNCRYFSIDDVNKMDLNVDDFRGVDVVAFDDVSLLRFDRHIEFFNELLARKAELSISVLVASEKPGDWKLLGPIQAIEIGAPDIWRRKAIIENKNVFEMLSGKDVDYLAALTNDFSVGSIFTLFDRLQQEYRHTNFVDQNAIYVAINLYKLAASQNTPTIKNIVHATSLHYGVSVDDIVSASRKGHIVRARQVAMYLARKLTPRSLPEIGAEIGRRDHTTVLHAVDKIVRLQKTDLELVDALTLIRRRVDHDARRGYGR